MTEKLPEKPRPLLFKIGIALLLIACLFWLGVIVLPFLPLPGDVKTGAIAFSLITAEVVFWIGAACTGKEFTARYKKHLSLKQWKRSKNEE